MRRIVLGWGLLGGLLIALLRVIEYRYLVLEHSLEVYGGLVAVLFSSLGLWLGHRLRRPRGAVPVPEAASPPAPPAPPPARFERDGARQEALGITARELEILELIAVGLSTREIAGQLGVSENTVKTHASRLFTKLSARRRTQAVVRGREAGLIP